MEIAMLIKNKSTTRLYTVQGVALPPGESTDIPEHLQELVQRDMADVEDLEVVKARHKASDDEPKAAKGKEADQK